MLRRIGLLALCLCLIGASHATAAEIRIEGTVQIPGGAALPEIAVLLFPLHDSLVEARDAFAGKSAEPVARAITNSEGRFRMMAPHAGLWSVRVEAPGFVPATATLKPLISDVELAPVELATDRGLTIRVVDEQDAPVVGARVLLRGERSGFGFERDDWTAPLRSGVTAEDGTLRLPRGERERASLSVTAAGRVLHELRGLPGTAATVRLTRGQARTLEVRASDGRPVGGVTVSLGQRRHPIGVTDASGKLTAQSRSSGPTVLNLLADDGRRLEARLTAVAEADPEPRRFTLPDRLSVSGRVIDARTRRPVGGGLVWDRRDPIDAVVTDQAGGFELHGTARARLEITAGAPGYMGAAGHAFQLADDGRPGPVLTLDPAAALSGRVTDADGAPVEGAEVRIEVKRNPGRMRIEIGGRTLLPRARSNADGRFRLGPIDPEKNYTLRVRADGFAAAAADVTDLAPYRTRSDLQIELSRGSGLHGTIVDADGLPLTDAIVRIEPASDGGGMRMMRMMETTDDASAIQAATGRDGRFELTGVPPGKFDLEITRKGFAKRSVPSIEVAAAQPEPVDLGEIALTPGERVQGFVIDRDGQPVEGVEVFVQDGGPTMMIMAGPGGSAEEAETVTDPAGWFVIDDLGTESRYSFRFSRTGFVAASVNAVEIPQAGPIEVVLDPASTVSGRVLDPEGEPIIGARVNMTRTRTMEMGGSMMQMMMMMDTTSDSEGQFLFEDQEPGSISLSASSSGFQEARLDNLEIPKGENLEEIELPLEKGAVVFGNVFAPDGRPAIGASVRLVTERKGPMIPDGSPSDGSGFYRVEGVAPGEVSIEATHPDYPRTVRDIEARAGANELDLHFSGGHEVSGTVVDETGNPVPQAQVRLDAAGRFFGGPESRSSSDGTFTMPGVQDGDYRLWVDAEGFASFAGELSVSVAGEPVAGLVAQLSAGGTIHGTIRGLAPEKFSDVNVQAEGMSFMGFGGVAVDYEGNYRLEHLGPGSYNVVATMGGSGRRAQGQAVLDSDATEVRVDLEFGAGLTLSGRTTQGGEPIRGATVFVEGVDVTQSGFSQTNNRGEFSIEGLEPGDYEIHVRNWQTGLAYTESVELATSRKVEIEVPTARVVGVIADASDRQPLAGVSLTLRSEAQDSSHLPTHTGTTDLNGRFELPNVADGSWNLTATKQGYATITEVVAVHFEKQAGDLRLSMAATEGLTLLAQLPTGGAPSEIRVAVIDGSGTPVVSGNFATGENGRVRLSSVPPGSWELIVSAAGAATSSFRADAPGAGLPVPLQPATTLKVSVPELRNSNSVALISLTDSQNRPFRALSWSGRPRSEWRMTGGEIEFASLPPGSWQITVAAADGRTWQDGSVTVPGAVAEVTLE